ncbi:MAG: hypothetical protein OXE46_13665 [Chloroflexi bacterium]|nr:hypothetical protein [Chloroflexota bacterium]
MKRTDLLLKIIAAANGEPLTPAQLQKVAFILGMERPNHIPDDYYKFIKYDYGPFSAQVYRDAEQLEREGKVIISIHPRGGWRQYSATIAGIQSEAQEISDEVSTYIKDKVRWARELSFQELVRAVYRKYPSFRENSVFQG